MPRHYSFWLLIGIIGLFGFLLFHVIRPFVVAIFIALVWIGCRLGFLSCLVTDRRTVRTRNRTGDLWCLDCFNVGQFGSGLRDRKSGEDVSAGRIDHRTGRPETDGTTGHFCRPHGRGVFLRVAEHYQGPRGDWHGIDIGREATVHLPGAFDWRSECRRRMLTERRDQHSAIRHRDQTAGEILLANFACHLHQ